MTADQIETLFGDITVAEAAWWFIAAMAFLTFLVVFVWPKLSTLIRTVDLIAGLGARLKSLDDTMERVRAQVENSHSTNLREEQDERHTEIVDELKGIKKDIGRLDDRDVNTAKRITLLDKKLDEHIDWSRNESDRIDNLEDTIEPRKDRL